jgi:hypothetical protein
MKTLSHSNVTHSNPLIIYFRYLRKRLAQHQRDLLADKKKEADILLSSCLPAKIVPYLRLIDESAHLSYQNLSQRFEELTCMFAELLILSTDPSNPYINPLDQYEMISKRKYAHLKYNPETGVDQHIKSVIKRINGT